MTDALVGHTGFVGTSLKSQHEFGAFYRSIGLEPLQHPPGE